MKHYTRQEVEAWSPAGVIESGIFEYDEAPDLPYVIAYGPFGTKLYLHAEDKSLTPHLSNEPFWEAWVTSWMTGALMDADNFIDVGANCGYYTALARGYDVNVMAFEANPVFAELMELSFWDHLGVNIYPVALGSEYGTAKLGVLPDFMGSSGFRVTTGTFIEVPVRRMDDYINSNNLRPGNTLIKLDIEEAEEDWFKGASAFLRKYRPTIVMEHSPNAYSDAFYDVLTAYGMVTGVNLQGTEYSLSESEIKGTTEWMTLVVRPHG